MIKKYVTSYFGFFATLCAYKDIVGCYHLFVNFNVCLSSVQVEFFDEIKYSLLLIGIVNNVM